MKITKEEISLCEQVAKKHRKEIKCGDWVFSTTILPKEVMLVETVFYAEEGNEKSIGIITKEDLLGGGDCIPLWTISDCLEFLEGKGFNTSFEFARLINKNWRFTAESLDYISMNEHKVTGKGKTRLAACLKAVLAVLEEEER